mgnify:CR=1 FL=1
MFKHFLVCQHQLFTGINIFLSLSDYPDYSAANYEEGNYEDTAVKYEREDDRYREGEEEGETNGRNYNNEYEGEDY